MTTNTTVKLGRRPVLVPGTELYKEVEAKIVACELPLADICNAHGISRTSLHKTFPGLRRKHLQKKAGK